MLSDAQMVPSYFTNNQVTKVTQSSKSCHYFFSDTVQFNALETDFAVIVECSYF